MKTDAAANSLARQAERLARRIDELAIHRSKREHAKAELFAAFALVDILVAATEALRSVMPALASPPADAGLGEVEREARP